MEAGLDLRHFERGIGSNGIEVDIFIAVAMIAIITLR